MKILEELSGLFFRYYWYAVTLKNTPNVFKKVSSLESQQYQSREELKDIQFKAFKKLLRYSYSNSAYYYEKFNSIHLHPSDINDRKDIAEIPILRKRDIQLNLDSVLSRSANSNYLIKDATGGSTGEPLIFYHDKGMKEWFEACDIFVKRWWGVKPWHKKAFLWGTDRDIPELTAKAKLKLKLERVSFLNSFNMDDKKMKNYAQVIEKWRPEYLQGYASSLYFFARFLKERRISLPHPKALRSSAETLHNFHRDLLEEVFGNILYNFYGSREVTNIAAECPAHEGLHIISPIRFLEVLDSNGEEVKPGEPGNIVVTDLTNYSMPFIRYEIGDIGIMANNECECGRSFPLLKEVTGRESDFIQTRDGKYIHGEFFTHLFYGVERVAKFQVLQKDLRSLLINIVKDGPIEASILDNILKKIETKMGKDVNVIVKFVDTIPASKTGKHRFTISEVKPNF